MASRKGKKKEGSKRPQRASSNVFAQFEQSQVQELKEAFTMIDQNRDGFLDVQDISDTWASLGKKPEKAEVQKMCQEAGGAINFTMFLTLFGAKMGGTDPEDVIMGAWKQFDPQGTGILHKDQVKHILKGGGERFNDEELNQMFEGVESCLNEKGEFDYQAFTRIVKRGEEEEE
ncbi:myosin regulatory light chain 12B-like isoform X2 [Branchiostoma floridae]|uniref:Myosin regulatory light chain 12B-like isoform X1 n=2 Tax=Branchiostoma TaxID=7737 RepID=A0A9J7KM65_BRAFL|nr:PREDICTED: myosin regulatory light chain 12B-like [Branchiostoma belcheri]XP_035666543.1 myosin regulatory light chain 12B-like isoform X1 [Branchiostoma floridae]XP_035666544.1 myosin regulatory light chain 12B-like isoform X2 [Branchiostoma floridae]KAI8478999.1 Myosin regulatory light polypeptide 9 [Branchiostoma belcheri]KAI8479569.1 Myosin regulatory light polypeptide 9 [Branchiostoma belcheri]KAI8496075.1 Myosin regulatory light polypeptide 9 [Branchiostoma belcheri]